MNVQFKWKMPNLPGSMERAINAGLISGAEVIKGSVFNQFGSSSKRGVASPPGTPPNRQTGNLARSIRRNNPQNRRIQVFTTNIYAPVHERGLTITAKRSQYLTIPLSEKAKTRARSGKGARGVAPKTIIIRSRKGNLLIMGVAGRKGKTLTPHYVLKKQVKMPKRPFMLPGFAKSVNAATDAFARVAAETLTREIVA